MTPEAPPLLLNNIFPPDDARKAAELVNEIRPEIAIPVHYGSVAGSPADADRFSEMVSSSIKVEIKRTYP